MGEEGEDKGKQETRKLKRKRRGEEVFVTAIANERREGECSCA